MSSGFTVNFKVNESSEDTDRSHLATPTPPTNPVATQKHTFEEVSPTYQVCKICSKPEEAETHFPIDDNSYETINSNTQNMMVQDRPLIEMGDITYSDGGDDETAQPMYGPASPSVNPAPQTITPNTITQDRINDLEMEDLSDTMAAVELLVNSEILSPENMTLAEQMLDDIESLIYPSDWPYRQTKVNLDMRKGSS